jgi:hypothetical protein
LFIIIFFDNLGVFKIMNNINALDMIMWLKRPAVVVTRKAKRARNALRVPRDTVKVNRELENRVNKMFLSTISFFKGML